VTGFLEPGVLPLEQAMMEIVEETGLAAETVRLVGAPAPLRIERPGQGWVWVVYPFLFDADSPSLRLDWEHDEYRWIDPADLESSDCVPWIRDVWLALGG
jgi:8-oxo-dGTP pyrophosphatase MutT (NUDIX family)